MVIGGKTLNILGIAAHRVIDNVLLLGQLSLYGWSLAWGLVLADGSWRSLLCLGLSCHAH